MAFTRMDKGTVEDWMVIAQETVPYQEQVADRILAMLRQLESFSGGFGVNQLAHALQTATLAERAGAPDDLVVGALCHDIGKVISVANHPAIAAEILKPYVSEETYRIIGTHQDFQGRHYYELLGKNPEERAKYTAQPWYAAAERFTDEWDQTAFDPDYDSETLEHFEPLVRKVFGEVKIA
ncbi:MAG TPA: HD domain-containing protein [Mycobacteriales bacterium]|nr:HD domain-containing protein [Mycobacteriales bacterium]